uniref:Uncharacterized protein n=1 Tax=Cacopsylla melanoneura TaxID=428564 RepID=A0A8D8ZKW6_9HEMI
MRSPNLELCLSFSSYVKQFSGCRIVGCVQDHYPGTGLHPSSIGSITFTHVCVFSIYHPARTKENQKNRKHLLHYNSWLTFLENLPFSLALSSLTKINVPLAQSIAWISQKVSKPVVPGYKGVANVLNVFLFIF